MKMPRTKLFFRLVLASLVFAATSAHAQRLYGTNAFNNSCVGGLSFCGLFYLDPVTGAILEGRTITLPGFTVTGALAVTVDPTTNEIYVILKVAAVSGRVLAKLNVDTGVATQVGNLGDSFSSLTFRGGQLFGTTGDGATVPETLFLINKATAVTTLATALGNGLDGEVIAYNPADDMLYHWSGNGTVVFEKVLPDPPYTVTSIPITGTPGGETFGAVWNPATNGFIVHNISNFMTYWSPTGVVTNPQAPTVQDVRGLALVFPAPIATLARSLAVNSASEAGLGVGVPEIWYRARLVENRSYQISAWPVDHEQDVDAGALSVAVFSDDAGTVPAAGVVSVSGVLEATPNQGGDAKPVTAVIQPTASGLYKIRVQRATGAAFHSMNVSLRETTIFSPWTSRAAGFEGFIEVHNNTNAAVSLTLRGFNNAGVVQGAGLTITLQPNATDFRTASQVGVPVNTFAGIAISHNGAFGALSGNITTLNTANGLSFDSPFTTREFGLQSAPVR